MADRGASAIENPCYQKNHLHPNPRTMNSISLENLHDIAAPPPVPWWPPAPGWYAVALTLLLIACWAVISFYLRWKRNEYRRQALAKLAELEQGLAEIDNPAPILRTLPELLKRSALAAYGRESVAYLAGRDWLAWLDTTAGRPLFRGETGDLLLACAYGKAERIEQIGGEQARKLFRAAHDWLKTHRPPQET